jgi:hypothetical protein
MTIVDLDDVIEKWFEMDGGGRVQLKTITPAAFKEIQKQTVKKKVDYKKVDNTPARFPYEEIDTDLQNELFWDIIIASWDGLSFKHPETGVIVLCTPDNCTKEYKTLLMTGSKKFSKFVTDSLNILSEDEAVQKKTEEKN